MRWQGRRQSDNVEDRRGMGGKTMAVGGGLGTMIIAAIVYFLGGDPEQVMNNNNFSNETTQQTAPANDEQTQFLRAVLASTEDTWNAVFEDINRNYQKPTLVFFEQATQSGCGFASEATGPFYCPADGKVYLDVSFFAQLKNRFDAPGDFAQAYVVAHEVGHHVQNLLGATGKLDAMRGRISESEMNALSVRLELQADFYAGLWAHYENQVIKLEPGDMEEALTAANAIGDDRLQMQSQGYVVPDAFTHGTSQQRMYWFKKGYETGDIRQGDTFSASDL